ncbi:hypothetical protein ASD15_26905 [Massilia sp. Root351]|nr:hypothetical protein ASD15_26905 [Massilia sp. Root351]
MIANLAASNAPTTIAGLKDAYKTNGTVKSIIDNFGSSPESQALYAGADDAAFITAIYQNVLNRDPLIGGLTFWVTALARKDMTRAEAATQIMAAAVKEGGNAADAAIVNNKIEVAKNFTAAIDTAAEVNGYKGAVAAAQARELLHNVNGDTVPADYQATVEATLAAIANGTGSSVALTNGTDTLTANIFNAGLVYTPSGDDRINSLQSEDVLTGKDVSATANNILNATLGNANDNGAKSITATLKNIQTINLDITGDTNTLDVRFADSLKTLAINKLTLEAADTVNIKNIGQPAANLSVKNSAAVDGTVNFDYVDGVLAAKNAAGTAAGGDTGNVTVENVALAKLHIGNNLSTEGFETINLLSQGTNTIKDLNVVDAETVVITGAGSLNLINNTTGAGGEFTKVNAGGITIGDGIGVRTIDATAYAGNTNINISTAVGGHNDPGNSGKVFHSEVKLGAGDDTLWTTSAVTSTTVAGVVLSDVIDGGAGHDTLRTFSASVTKNAKITNVEALELRGATSSAYISAFDANLTSALMRNEVGGAPQTFSLHNTTKTLAENGNIVLRHGIGAAALNDVVDVNLADASAASDTVVLTVQNDLNTGTKYNYVLNAQSQLRADVLAGTATATAAQLAATKVENVTVNDNDTETNVLTLTRAADHTGTFKLTGGTAGLDYTVASTLVAKTVDAATQLSNLRLTVGTADQTINLGVGSDILTFATLDSFNGSDTITDAGGIDTVRAAFSKDVTGTPSLTGIEKLHIVATENVAIDMSKATTVTELAILSDKAVSGDADLSPVTAEPFGLVGVDATDVITLKNTALSTLNFFGDNESIDPVPPAAPTGSQAQIFNGVTLENNTGDALAVAINSSLDAGIGASSYTLGQLTVHGVKNMAVTVGNELAIAAGATASATTTTINNVYGKNLQSFVATANGNLALGTVSGSGLANTMTTFDTTAVKGNLTANVIILGDNAQVKLGNGINTFSALGSAGKGVTITSGTANDVLTGTAQSDTIIGGAGNDIINANRGDNVVDGGVGDETVTAGDGNNTVSFGAGHYETAAINITSGNDASKANNSFSLAGTIANLQIDVTGNGATADDVNLTVAVGTGSDLTLNYNGGTLQAATAVLDGRLAVVDSALTGTATANADLFIDTAAGVAATTMNGGAGNDVLMGLDTAAAYTLNGGAGNDALIEVGGASTLTGGTGADRYTLADTAGAATDTIVIADGESLASGFDQVVGFSATVATGDRLDLSSTVVGTTANLQANVVTSTGSGQLISAATSATNGIVTFGITDVTGTAGVETSAIVSTATDTNPADAFGYITLSQALAFLAQQLNNTGATVAFAYDYNGDGAITSADSTIVFQDGATDTVVELIGTVGVTAVSNAALAANTIYIV